MIYSPTAKQDPRTATTRIIHRKVDLARRADLFNPKVPRMDTDDLPDGALESKHNGELIEALTWIRDSLNHIRMNPHENTPETLVGLISRADAAIYYGGD